MTRTVNALAVAICVALAACGGGGGGVESGGSQPPPASNTPPVANAGGAQNVAVGAAVRLDGSASRDADGTSLTYRWTLTARPYGSAAVLANDTASSPTFIADLHGNYSISLTVSDGSASTSDSATIVAAPVIKTRINGMVSADTTLTAADSPYELLDRLQIADGVTLVVQPGVSVYGGNNCTGGHCVVEVFGTFSALGSAASQVQLHGLDIVKGNSGARQISIQYARMKNTALQPDVLRDSFMAGAWVQPILCSGFCAVERNVIMGGSVIASEAMRIANNAFYDQHVGFSSSQYAVEARSAGLTIVRNSFITSSRPSVLVGANDANMAANYWGTSDLNTIRGAIIDRNDDLNIQGYGYFEPILLERDADTPDIRPYL